MQEYKIRNSQRFHKREVMINEVKACWTPPKYFKRYR